MSLKNPNFVVTDLEDSDEEGLVKNLLTSALNQSPKISRGTSTIKEWMAIIEGSEELNQHLALTTSQRQTLETYGSSNPDMELDADHIMCMYSMIRKSQPFDLSATTNSATDSSINKTVTLTKPNLAKKQHSHILQQKVLSPSSPTPSEQQQQSVRVESSASQRIIDPSSRLLDHDIDEIPFRPQSKGKKVSIDPTLGCNTTTNNDSDNTSRHDSDSGGATAKLRKDDGPTFWKNSSMNLDDIKGDENTKNRGSSIFDDTEDRYSGPNAIHERLLAHRQNNKLSFQPLEGNWKSQALNSQSTNHHRQQEHLEQQADKNAILMDALMKQLEDEIQALRQKVNDYEIENAQQKNQIEELNRHIEKLTLEAGTADEKYQEWREKLTNEMNNLQEKLNRNQAQLEGARDELLAAKHRCLELQKESTYWKSMVEEKKDEYDILQKDMEHVTSLREKMELEAYLKNEALKKSQLRIEELDKIIPPNMTFEKVQETLTTVDRLQKEKQTLETMISSTVNELASMTKGYEALQQKVKELERQRDQQLKDMTHATGPSSLWYQRESINQDKKRLSSVCKQLDSQANVIEQLRLQLLSSGSKFHQDAMDRKSPRWLVRLLGVLGLLIMILLSATIYAINSPPVAYGLWNDPHGYQGQWLPDAPSPRNPILLMLDRLLLPKNYTFTPPM